MDTANTVAAWILPINCNWFWLFIIASLILTLIAWIWTCAKYSEDKYVDGVKKTITHPIKTFFRGSIAAVFTGVALAFIIWIIAANNQPVEVASEEKLDIKPVTYPNGRVVQMFSCDGTNYNANEMFRSAPPAGSYVRRLIYKRDYVGVYFPVSGGGSKSSLNDGFFLVTPDKNERPADAVVPDKQ